MLRQVRLFGVLVFILGFTGNAWAQNFSNVVVFGASLSDTGNIAQHEGLPAGSSFVTNPDPLAAEIIAQTFGASGMNSLAGGPNYAWSGACVRPEGPCFSEVPTITDQVDQYLSLRPGGEADPDAVHFLWAGLNDINDTLFLDQANAESNTLAAATAHAGQIRRLQEAGARYIVVPNLPDLSVIPFAANLPPTLRGALTALSGAYNEVVYMGLRQREDGIIPVNILALTGEILESPQTYGFTNVSGTACPLNANPLADRSPVSLVCGPEGSGYPKTYAPGTNRSYLFADDKHPSGAGHAMIARLVTSTLAAPVQVSLAGEGGVEMAGIHRSAVSAERMADLGLDRSVGSWRAYVTGRIGKHKLDALPRLGETQANVQVLTLGANHRAGSNLWWGAALSFGRYNNDASGASLDSTAVIGSVHGTWRRGGLYVSGALSAGSTSVDVKRSITLGPAVRAEQGSTSAGQFGAELDAGWILGPADGLQHGPFFGLAWLNQTVDGYRESGNLSTSMNFSGFDRDSLIARAGYRVTRTLVLDRVGLRPYANVAVAKEFKDDPISVTAGSNTMPGRFTLSGFTPPRHWASTDLGLVVSLYEKVSVFAGYSGRLGSESREDHRLNLGLRMTF